MNDVILPPGGEVGKVNLPKAKEVKIILNKKIAEIVEIKDVFFHDGSAVMLPADPAGPFEDKKKVYSAFKLIRAAYVYARENPKKRLVITGHSDKSGGETKDNFELSKLMSDSVYNLLIGKKAEWIQAVKNANNVEDHKYIIKYYFGKYKLGSDPGEINSTSDDKSKKAVKNFKRDYNKMFGKMLTLDEKVDENFWGAIYDVYMKDLAESVGEKDEAGLSKFRKEVQFVDAANANKNIFGCAESIPVDVASVKGIESKKNSRVALIFFDNDKMTAKNIMCMATKEKAHDFKKCPFYNNTIKGTVLDPAKIFGKGPQVTITKLDKWFIPGEMGEGKTGEECKIEVEMGGRKGLASQFEMDVYGSNYCDVKLGQKGALSFTKLGPEIPIYRAVRNDPVESGKKYTIDKWSGQSNAKKGMLKPRENKTRYINVAFSPYTVHFRWYKDAVDKEAQIELLDFWPQWIKEADVWKPVNDSLKIKWKINKSNKKLKSGELIIYDRKDIFVFKKELKEGDLSDGEHSFDWDGKLKDKTKMKKTEMPYRVQITAHSDGEEPKGVALAAMHTEVRLFVHPDTGINAPPDDWKDPNSLDFAIAQPDVERPDRAKNATKNKWYQYHLAELGFHPGPVDGSLGTITKRAISEFQRFCSANNAAPYTRLKVTGGKNNATEEALARHFPLPPPPNDLPLYPIFGNPENNDPADMTKKLPLDLNDSDAETRLNDTRKTMIIWINDRHYYTKRFLNNLIWSGPTSGPHVYRNRRMYMNNYRGDMDVGDKRVTLDAKHISRPWIPIKLDFKLCPKDTTSKGLASKLNKCDDVTRRAIGPLRIDWTFKDLGEDVSLIGNTLSGGGSNYDKKYTRSRTHVRTTVADYTDTQDGITYSNCPEKIKKGARTVTIGGIRPVKGAGNATDTNKYFKRLFGRGKLSRKPWRARSIGKEKVVYTVVHDDFNQAEEKLFDNCIGQTGVFLRPSIIAGDGYRFRAQLHLAEFPNKNSKFPNWEILKRRYEIPPRAYTSGIRMWRKSSVRGFIGWCPAGEKQWATNRSNMIRLYQPAFVHMVQEGSGNPAPPTEFNINNLIDNATYQDLVRRVVTTPPMNGRTANLNTEYVWPFTNERHMGFPRSNLNQSVNDYYDNIVAAWGSHVWLSLWYSNHLLLYLLSRIEQLEGRMKGHLVAQFKVTPQIDLSECECGTCGITQVEVTNNCVGAQLLNGSNCPGRGAINSMVEIWNGNVAGGLSPTALGMDLGAAWVYSGTPEVWTHEIGHNRHLEHCQSQPGTWAAPNPDSPIGFKNEQHDITNNPGVVAPVIVPPHPAVPAKDSCWDRSCVMSYNDVDRNFFCGKCLLKNRGWAIERLDNPGPAVHDP